MELMQRGLKVADDLVTLCDDRVKAATSSVPCAQVMPEAEPHTEIPGRGCSDDTRLQSKQQRNLYTCVPHKPRSIDTFKSFASISYGDLSAVYGLPKLAVDSMCPSEVPAQSQTFGSAACSTRSAVDMTKSIPSPSRINEPIDTSFVTLRGLAEEHMRRSCAKLQVPQSEICWWVETNFPISGSHNLAFSSQLGSKECAASCVLALVMATFEFMLFTLSGFRCQFLFHCHMCCTLAGPLPLPAVVVVQ